MVTFHEWQLITLITLFTKYEFFEPQFFFRCTRLFFSYKRKCIFVCEFPAFFLITPFFRKQSEQDLEVRYEKCYKPTLINGKVRLNKRDRIARFKCNPTFQLVGEKYATCLRGHWDAIPTCVRSGCLPLPTFNNGQRMETYRGAVVKFICNPGYSMIGSSQIYCDGSRWNGSLPRCTASARSTSTMCDFESPYICGWTQDPFHIFNWSRQNYQTPSRNIGTGPSFDHTLGPGKGGYYMFIETSSPRIENDTARLFSPVYSPDLTSRQPSCFLFWYHMYGATTGMLNVYVKPEGTAFDSTLSPKFTKSGNQGDEWFLGIVNLSTMYKPFQVIVEALRGSSYVSDIAIDDVKITNGRECIDVVKILTTIEPPTQSTTPQWTKVTSRTIRPGGATFTYPTPPPPPPLPPFPSPESFTITERDAESTEFLTSPVTTDTYKLNNSTQMPYVTTYNPQHQPEVFSTTEESKRIPIPSEPTPLILVPRTSIIKRGTDQTMMPTTSTRKLTTSMISIPTNRTIAINLTSTTQETTIPTTKTTTIPKTTNIETTTKTTTTLKPKSTLAAITKPIFIPLQTTKTSRITRLTTTQSRKSTAPIRTTKQTTPLTTLTTTKPKPRVLPSFPPKFPTFTISTTYTPSTQEPDQEKIVTVNMKVKPYVTTEETDVTVTHKIVSRGKKWIEARRGPIAEKNKSMSVSSIVGIIVAVTLIIVSLTTAAYFYVKHRKRTSRQSHISDDSDVRFLTSDEVLDFSLARPSDSGEDDL